MSQQNQHLTHAMLRKPATTTPKQFQTTWCFGKDRQHTGGAGDLESATVFPGILPFCWTAKALRFVKPVLVLAQRSLQQSHFRGREHISFLDSKKWFSPVALKACCSIKANFDPLASCEELRVSSCKVPHCQKWDCHALPLFALDRAIPRLLSILF